jgi:hypothetical protein
MKFWIVLLAATASPFVVRACLLSPIIAPAPPVQTSESQPHSFLLQISFGYGAPRDRWNGTFRADDAEIAEAKGWLLRSGDRVSLNGFDLQTVNARTKAAEPKGFLLRGAASPAGRISVSTGLGEFSFKIGELDAGKEMEFLEQSVRVSGMLQVEKLSRDSREDDYPSVAAQDGMNAWTVWQSYSGQSDQIRLSRYQGGWRTFTLVPEVSGDVFRPQIGLGAAGQIWVVWSQQVDGNFDIYARALDEKQNTWLRTERLSSHPNPDINHRLASDGDGRLWVVWQGFHSGNSDIYLRHYDGSEWHKEVRLSEDPANDWDPSVAVDRQGGAVAVWDSYRNGNYDVFLRTFKNKVLGPEITVAGTPALEAHPTVAIDKTGRVWVAWDEGEANWGKDSGPTTNPHWLEGGKKTWDNWINQPSSPGARLYESRRVDLAIFEGNERKAPVQDLRAALSMAGIRDHDYPKLLTDPSSGRVALLFRRWNQVGQTESLGFRAAYWEQALTFYEGDRWSPALRMPESWGRPSMQGDASFGADGSLWVAWPTDNRLCYRPIRDVVSSVYAARVPPGIAREPVLAASNTAPSPQASAVHPREKQDVATMRSYRTLIHGTENRIVRGDLHRHTEFSWDSSGGMVDGSIFDFYRYMLDAAAMDFGALTDHNSGGDYEYGWWLIEKSCDLFHIPGVFTPFYAYERSVQFPGGHRNILHTRRGNPVVPFFTKPGFEGIRPGVAANWDMMLDNDTRLLYEALRRSGGIAIPHTTGSNMGTDWRDHDPEVEPAVEIFQGDRISYEHPGAPRAPRGPDDRPIGGYQESGFLWSAYRKGIKLGTIASSDHWSTHISYAMVYSEQPTRDAIFEAIKKRRTYGATDNIVLDCRMGEHFMGEAFTATKVPPIEIRAIGTSAVALLEIIKNEKVIYSGTPGKKEVTLRFQDQSPSPGPAYYYVRLVQDDRQVAWGSPIWMTYKP